MPDQERYHEWILKQFKKISEEEDAKQKANAQKSIQRNELDANRRNTLGHDFAMGWDGEVEREALKRRLKDF